MADDLLRLHLQREPTWFNKDMALAVLLTCFIPLAPIPGAIVAIGAALIGGWIGKKAIERENAEGKIVNAWASSWNEDTAIGGLSYGVLGKILGSVIAPGVGTVVGMIAGMLIGRHIGAQHGIERQKQEYALALQQSREPAIELPEQAYVQQREHSHAQQIEAERAQAAEHSRHI